MRSEFEEQSKLDSRIFLKDLEEPEETGEPMVNTLIGVVVLGFFGALAVYDRARGVRDAIVNGVSDGVGFVKDTYYFFMYGAENPDLD